jgi:hypothetical protein
MMFFRSCLTPADQISLLFVLRSLDFAFGEPLIKNAWSGAAAPIIIGPLQRTVPSGDCIKYPHRDKYSRHCETQNHSCAIGHF